MLKRTIAAIFLASIAFLGLLTFLAVSANSVPDPGLSRVHQTINRVIKQDPQLPALPGEGRVEIRGDESGHAPAAPHGSAQGNNSNTQAGPDTFYGNETLYPLIDSGTMIIHLPGGTRVEIREGETTYVLTDHLGSARVALRADNTVSGRIEYTPFGERLETGDAKVVRSYTGKVFEPETGTYDFHARRYDPSVGRFTSVDAARQSISPYSYASNNPINMVDPDGLGPVYFFFYSELMIARPGVPKMSVVAEAPAAPGSPITLSTQLENPRKLSIPLWDKLQHITIKQHSVPDGVYIKNPETGRAVKMNGEEFAAFLYNRLEASSGGASGDLKSVFFNACRSACRTEPLPGASNQTKISFADSFANSARTRTLFPELEHVIATPYRIGAEPDLSDLSKMLLDVYSSNDRGNLESLRIRMDSAAFFRGDFPLTLLDPPSRGIVHDVYVRAPHESAAAGTGQYVRSTDSETISNFISSNDFTEPVFRNIPVPPLVIPETD